MRKASGGMVLALLAAPVPAQPAPPERLAAPVLPGFIVGYEASGPAQSIREEVPRGETVGRWTRMVTTQRFAGVTAPIAPEAYVRTIADRAGQVCPGAVVSPVTALTVSRRPASRLQVDCPRGPAGGPESFLLLAIAGQSGMYVKQVAFRGPKSAADLAWANGFLAKTVLCRPRDPQVSCR